MIEMNLDLHFLNNLNTVSLIAKRNSATIVVEDYLNSTTVQPAPPCWMGAMR